MSEILQWVIVGAAVVVATVFLVRRMRKRASGTCGSCCEVCPEGSDVAEKCADESVLNRENAKGRKGRKPES